jgi:DNA polymerase IV (DinB-like DNA polymerase)
MDLDSFYASAEELRRPEIRGRPIIICVFSGRSAESGAVATANYAARKLGIKAGMPIAAAKRLASETIFLARDMNYYREISERIMDLLEEECDVIEQAGIDEAYLDVTKKSTGSWENAEAIAGAIKQKIKEKEGLTCSIGIGPNKLIAKMASRVNKPDGLTIVKEKDVRAFMEKMNVKEIHGIGIKTEEILNSLKIKTAEDLAKANVLILEEKLGRNRAKLLQEKAAGVDKSPVEPRITKQISRIGTLKEDTDDKDIIASRADELASELQERVKKKNVSFRTVSVILIDPKLEMQTRSRTIEKTNDIRAAVEAAREMLEKYLEENRNKKLRRIGISVSNLVYKKDQKSLEEFAKKP